jgi:hypothetical protein
MENKFFKLETIKGNFRVFLIAFVLSLSIGYMTGLYYISITSGFTDNTVKENYLGNEEVEDADVMKFKMSEKEVLSIVHNHIISFSLIFFALGLLLFHSSYPPRLVFFLTIEPFISIGLTFGGIWLMWKGLFWMKYIIILSGSVMHLIFISSVLLILIELLKKRRLESD